MSIGFIRWKKPTELLAISIVFHWFALYKAPWYHFLAQLLQAGLDSALHLTLPLHIFNS